jgi:fumarylacetoacetate (FAA) hydrolase family protein
MGLEQSGIPVLANELAKIPCKRRQNALIRYHRETLPQLLNDIELQCKQGLAIEFVSLRERYDLQKHVTYPMNQVSIKRVKANQTQFVRCLVEQHIEKFQQTVFIKEMQEHIGNKVMSLRCTRLG